jgi:hypothetical protein
VTALATEFQDGERAWAGWAAGGLVVAAVLATGAFLWFRYHPYP